MNMLISKRHIILAVLVVAYPAGAFRAERGGNFVVWGEYIAEAVARTLSGAGQVVLEFSQDHRDIEDYFVELMEGGATHV